MGFIRGEMALANLHYLVTAQCIPTNGILTTPMGKPIAELEGAVGGLLFKLVILVAVILLLLCVATVFSSKMAVYLRSLAFVFAVPLAGIVAIMGYTAIVTFGNASC